MLVWREIKMYINNKVFFTGVILSLAKIIYTSVNVYI